MAKYEQTTDLGAQDAWIANDEKVIAAAQAFQRQRPAQGRDFDRVCFDRACVFYAPHWHHGIVACHAR